MDRPSTRSPRARAGAEPDGHAVLRARCARACYPIVVARYDAIGRGYASRRREDPRFRDRIHAALGGACTVVNVGAGAGSYEARGSIRRGHRAERRDGGAAATVPPAGDPRDGREPPLRDASVDAAMTVLSLHHWDDERGRGVRELRRVARGPVVIVTYDARVSASMWLLREYLPEVAALDLEIFPPPEVLREWLGGTVEIEPLPIPRDTPDWMLGSFWAHPERVLDPDARAATSGFARMPPAVVDRVVHELSRDLADGSWDRRHGALRALAAYDVGLRLLVARR
ncbi:MAG: class I SAM-dependent methyltransferase [Sandaracinaceae bacterium]|nr:class I SAM-dependent methyltransferase [Sandaracinaceae bacterium]